MTEKQITKTSKFLSLVLRHKPETIGIKLDHQGWVDVEELIEKPMNLHELRLERVTEVLQSSGAATVSDMTRGFAPGKLAETTTEGGVTSGYSEMGS